MKKFTINCDFGGQIAPFTIYVGQPEPGHHPLHFQAEWLSKERGGTIPAQVMDAVGKLKDLAEKNKVSFEELCVYALGAAQQDGAGDASVESGDAQTEGSIEAPMEEIQKDAGTVSSVDEFSADEAPEEEAKTQKKKKSE